MSTIHVAHPALLDLFDQDVVLQQIATGFKFTEGPLWREGELLFSDMRSLRVVRYRCPDEGPEITTYSLGHSNGLALQQSGDVLVAEHYGRRVCRIANDGSRTVVADNYNGHRLNSPNDIVVKSDGAAYFTDPPYGCGPRASGPRPHHWWNEEIPGKELAVNGVYRLAPEGGLQLILEDAILPNGLAFSPDEERLYVADSAREHIRVFAVKADGTLANGRVLLDMRPTNPPDQPGHPDGMKVDVHGNIFCAGAGGIWVCDPDGVLLGRIAIPELPSNLAWGEDGSVLFVTARTSVYRLQTRTRGAGFLHA